jgi:uncharacterized integral membrane protein
MVNLPPGWPTKDVQRGVQDMRKKNPFLYFVFVVFVLIVLILSAIYIVQNGHTVNPIPGPTFSGPNPLISSNPAMP